MASSTDRPVRIGVSSCLLGDEVRYDGGHKRDALLLETLSHVEWVSFCPEVEAGMGVPREPIRLERRAARGELRVVAPKSGTDWTEALTQTARRHVRALASMDLSGYVLKSRSPSCGLHRVAVWRPGTQPVRDGTGVFAAALREAMPLLPLEEEGRLTDRRLRQHFLDRVHAYWALRGFFGGRWSIGGLVAFHAARKFAVLAHSPQGYAALGRLVAGARAMPRAALRDRYEEAFMRAMEVPATPARHVNVLQHLAGFFKRSLDAGDRAELADAIADYRAGRAPLVVPITLIRHHVRRLGLDYLAGQSYLGEADGTG
jgi:uncharacterized protein YbbK (DUF523 family)/uncharacterized protein YbgA (DUF1722 family)